MFPDREKALHVENPLLKAWTCLRHAPGKSRFNHDHEMNGGKSLNELVFWKPLLPKTWMITMMIGCLHFKSFKSPIYNIIIHYITPPRAVLCGRIRLKTDRVQWGKRWLWGPPWSPCLGNRHVLVISQLIPLLLAMQGSQEAVCNFKHLCRHKTDLMESFQENWHAMCILEHICRHHYK